MIQTGFIRRVTILGCLLLLSTIAFIHHSQIHDELSDLHKVVSPAQDPRSLRENCRLLGIISRQPQPFSVFEDVLFRFKEPRYPQRNGWSLSAYSNYSSGGKLSIPGYPMVFRSERNVEEDLALYSQISQFMIRLRPTLMIGHLRSASSGCALVADPHPFQHFQNGKHWLFIHNGGVWGNDLLTLDNILLDGEYLPENCPDYPIDSELLFVYLMKLMRETDLTPFDACLLWGGTLLKTFGTEWNALNIILTDGETIWAVRCSYADNRFFLNYNALDDLGTFIVSTEMLDHGWQDIGNFHVAEFRVGSPPRFEHLSIPDSLQTPQPIGADVIK